MGLAIHLIVLSLAGDEWERYSE